MWARTSTLWRVVVWSSILTVAIEAVTIFLRFGMGLESTRETASTIGLLTGGIRVHHGYGGLLLVLFAAAMRSYSRIAEIALIVGLALFFSDAVHHFLVLWPITGSPQFDLVYPQE